MSLAVRSVVIIMKPPIVPGDQIVGTARRDVSRKNRETRGEARGAVTWGGAEKERRACPTRFKFLLLFRSVPSDASAYGAFLGSKLSDTFYMAN